MGVITLSLSDDIEVILRKSAIDKFGSKKDALSKTVEYAIEKVYKTNNREDLLKRFKDRLDNPIKTGVKINGKLYESRDELYER